MKRLLSCLLCLTILIGSISYCSPKAKAVSVVGDLALAEAVTAAYLTSTGIELSVTAGGASAVTSGIAAAAGEYAAATGAAASGEAFLGTVAAGTAISTAGTIVLTAAAAVALGAFAYWLYDTYSVDTVEGSVLIASDQGLELADGRILPNGQFKFINGNQVADSSGNLITNSSYVLLDIKNLFEPDPELVTDITTAFTDKFSWLETVHQFGEDLFGMTAESSPPVIYIHLEDAEGRYIYGGTELEASRLYQSSRLPEQLRTEIPRRQNSSCLMARVYYHPAPLKYFCKNT